MSRFAPETLAEALARPLAMAAPEAGVYVEFIAPDFRFLCALVLVAVVVVPSLRQGRGRPALALAGIVAAAFVPWLATTGNGRYFLAVLLLAGPLCVGLVHLLPVSRSARLAAAGALIALQLFALHEASPWRVWTFVDWRGKDAFPIEIPADVAATPATYVTLSNISYSLIAPRFHPQSRWLNLSRLNGGPDARRARDLLAASTLPRLLFPTLPGATLDGRPRPELIEAVNSMLGRHALALDPAASCRLLRSRGLDQVQKSGRAGTPDDPQGFWLCGLVSAPARPVDPSPSLPLPDSAESVFDAVERNCPRLFRRGEASTVPIAAGAMREYQGADTKVYVLHDGTVMYKYLRSLNPVVVGRAAAVLSGEIRIDCDRVRGRTVLPWQREI